MSLQYTVNATPATGAAAMRAVKTALKAQGWTVPRSSDGTTYNSTGDQITADGSGANGMANNNAWFVIQMPLANAVNRQLCIQRGTSNPVWRIKYSYSAGFTGGSPGSTQTPSATDEKIIVGAGTDASPTFTSIFGTDGTYRQNIAVDSATPYGWWSVCFPSGGGNPNGVMFMDPMATGSFPSADTDPYVMIFAGSGSGQIISGTAARVHLNALVNNHAVYAYLAKGLGGEGFVSVPMSFHSNASSTQILPAATASIGSNPSSSKDDLFPVLYMRDSAQTTPVGYKGRSSLFQYNGTIRSTGDTVSVASAGAKDYIMFGFLVATWNGSTPTV